MPVAPVSLLSHDRRVTTICAAVVGATFLAGLLASVTQGHERPRCRDHRRAAPVVVEAVAVEAPTLGCADRVAGTWAADEHRPDRGDWIQHVVRISVEDGTYVVDHTATVRDGDRRGPAAFRCAPAGMQFDTVGRAALEGDQLHVWGTALVDARARCDGARSTYSLDSFTGTVSGDTFDSVNNDGSTAVNRPYHFQRIACGDALP